MNVQIFYLWRKFHVRPSKNFWVRSFWDFSSVSSSTGWRFLARRPREGIDKLSHPRSHETHIKFSGGGSLGLSSEIVAWVGVGNPFLRLLIHWV